MADKSNEEFDLGVRVMEEYQHLIPYMVDPEKSAEEILQFKEARINPCSAEFILRSNQFAEELKGYRGRIEANRRRGIDTLIEIGDMDGFVRELFSYLNSGTQFVKISNKGGRRVNTPGAPFAGPKPGYSGHEIPDEIDFE